MNQPFSPGIGASHSEYQIIRELLLSRPGTRLLAEGRAIVVARWIPWIRTLAPMIAGAARMDNKRYITANAVGAACWVPTLILLGYYGAGLLDAAPWLKPTAAVLAIAGFIGGSAVGLWRFRQEMRRPCRDRGTVRDEMPARQVGFEHRAGIAAPWPAVTATIGGEPRAKQPLA